MPHPIQTSLSKKSDSPTSFSMKNLAYAGFFSVLVPLFIFSWSTWSNDQVTGPLPTRLTSVAMAGFGFAVLAWALATFSIRTRKLPINIDPPDFPVLVGPYRWLSDPIYTGFCIFVAGLAGACGLGFGFWFASPILMLLTVALVLGYENGRRPPRVNRPALMDWPEDNLSIAPRRATISTLLHGLLVSATIIFLSSLGRQQSGGFEWLGFLAFPLLIVLSLALRQHPVTNRELRRYVQTQYFGAAAILTLAFGSIGSGPLTMIPAGIATGASMRLGDGPGSHWICLAISLTLTVLLTATCDTRPFIFSLFIASFSTAAGYYLSDLHERAVRISEHIANSWSAIRIGPVRIINYAIYAFLSTFIGVVVFEMSIDDPYGLMAATISACVLLGAAVWGQAIEYSGRLARPFGYFGAVIGGILGVIMVAMFTDVPLMILGAGVVICTPWVQAIGRLRCLVQGCCHGRISQATVGIRYHRSESRVVCIAGLANTPLYPTQLFSVYANIFLGILLTRLWLANFAASVIVGTYFIVSGSLRFIEENFRGEPQTPVYGHLNLYQWLSILLVIGGIAVTCFSSSHMAAPSEPNSFHLIWAFLLGAISATAMGTDLPMSLRRFSRLTPS